MADKVEGEFKLYVSETLNSVGQVVVLIGIPNQYPLGEYYVFVAGLTKALYSGRLELDPTARYRNLDTPPVDADAAVETALAYVRIRWPDILTALAEGRHDYQHAPIELKEESSPQRALRILHSLGFQEELNTIIYRTRCRPLRGALDSLGHTAGLVEERDFHQSEK